MESLTRPTPCSALLLAPGGGEDGRLEAHEIFGLKMQAFVVAMSACETGGRGAAQWGRGDRAQPRIYLRWRRRAVVEPVEGRRSGHRRADEAFLPLSC